MSRMRVARYSEIPQTGGLSIQIRGRPIALFRLGFRVRAIDATCPHQGASLAGGAVEGSSVVCPLHAWKFCLESGRATSPHMARIRVYPVILEGDQVYIEWKD